MFLRNRKCNLRWGVPKKFTQRCALRKRMLGREFIEDLIQDLKKINPV